jgi:hypothetical protein
MPEGKGGKIIGVKKHSEEKGDESRIIDAQKRVREIRAASEDAWENLKGGGKTRGMRSRRPASKFIRTWSDESKSRRRLICCS